MIEEETLAIASYPHFVGEEKSALSQQSVNDFAVRKHGLCVYEYIPSSFWALVPHYLRLKSLFQEKDSTSLPTS